MLADLGFQAPGCVCPSVCVCMRLSLSLCVCVCVSINSYFFTSVGALKGGLFSSVAFVPPEGRCRFDGSSAFLAA